MSETTLRGARVDLAPVGPEVLETLYRWYQDPELVAPFDRYETDTFDAFSESVRTADGDPRSLAPRFAIERREDHQLLGCVGHYLAHPVLEYVDVWYVLGRSSERGHGYGTEAVELLIDHVFARSNIERVGATCDVENIGSKRLMEKLGLLPEGRLARALLHHGSWHDVFVYGITRSRWAEVRPSTRK
ncbi:MAG: GNAT family N-acetyltransferase [Thermoplasmata archaeon]